MHEIFDILFLLARPAAGKSEIIHYLQNLDDDDRKSRFHIGKMHVIDDFPMLWTWFEEDDLLTKMGYPRLYTDSKGYFLQQYMWDLLIERMVLEYTKYIRDLGRSDDHTVIFEFSRGKEHGGYKSAFAHIPKNLIQKAAILYVNVSWEESLRKNKARFNPNFPDSILEHSLPDEKLKKLYLECDFLDMSDSDSGRILINKLNIPYIILDNENDMTSKQGKVLSDQLNEKLLILFKLFSGVN
jgi:hypothetical protein